MSEEQGATGASPSPSTGVSTGSSPSTAATPPTQSPAQAGKGREYVAKMRDAKSEQNTTQPAEVSDEDFWKTHGDRIFKHERFRELNEAKKKLTPYQEFVESVGGLEQAQQMNQFLGPIWQKLSQDPDKGKAFWQKMYPIFSAFISDQDYNALFNNVQQAQVEQEIEEDPYAEKLKPVQTELETLKQELAAQKQNMQQRSQREQEQFRRNTLQQYLSAVDKRIASSEGSIPEDMRQEIAEIMGPRMMAFMPKHNGQPLHPLDAYSEEAFDACWNAVVEPLVKKMTGAALSKAKTVINKGGPALPDTNTFGKTAMGQSVPTSLQEKKARFAQLLRGS